MIVNYHQHACWWSDSTTTVAEFWVRRHRAPSDLTWVALPPWLAQRGASPSRVRLVLPPTCPVQRGEATGATSTAVGAPKRLQLWARSALAAMADEPSLCVHSSFLPSCEFVVCPWPRVMSRRDVIADSALVTGERRGFGSSPSPS
jgi:hypothetical protein